MGFFDFIRGAGKKLDEPEAPATPNVTPEQMRAAQDRRRATLIVKMVQTHAFKVSDLGVSLAGDTATLTGTADSHETHEKIVLLVGNVDGVARVDDQMKVSTTTLASGPATASVFHTVEKGETLSKIAKQYYGNASDYNKIFEANRPMLKDADHIYPGQALRIPGATATKTA